MKCLDCNFDEGTLLKEFDNEKNYSWYELSQMTEVCFSCGSKNINITNDGEKSFCKDCNSEDIGSVPESEEV